MWKRNMKCFSNETLNFFLRKYWAYYILDLTQTICRKNQQHGLEWKSFQHSTKEPCACEYVTLLLSYHRSSLSIHWYIALNFSPIFSMSVILKLSFKTIIFSRFFNKAVATSNFMSEVYNGGFGRKFSVLRIKETIALLRVYVYETRKWKAI